MTRVAVIGVGSMGKNHARVLSELSYVELVAVCDEILHTAESVAERYQTRAFTNYKELLESEQPEAVVVAVPTALHAEITTDALEAGANVLIEKPIAATIEEGEGLVALAEKQNRQLMVGHIVRFNPATQLLKQKLDKGDLGRIFQIFCRRAGPFPARIRDVGVIIDLAPHDLDVMRFLTGREPIHVFAETERRIHTEHEDLLFGLLRFPDGITGALEINWLTPTKVRETLVLGERGLFQVDDLTQDLYFYENAEADGELWSTLRNLKGVSEGSMIRFAIHRQEPLKVELEAFIQAVQTNTPVPVSGEDGLAALRLAQAFVKSGQIHQVIKV